MSSDLLSYLTEKLSCFDDLYANPWTCQAIFRTLSPLAQQYIMRLLYIGERELSARQVKDWYIQTEEGKTQHSIAITQLTKLKLLICEKKSVESRRNGATSRRSFMRINPVFQEQMKVAVSNSCASPWATTTLDPEKKPPTLEMLRTFSRRQWESVVSKLFGGAQGDPTVILLFATLGLMEDNGSGLLIAKKGFQFLFQDPFKQIWTLLEAYLQQSEHRIELLTFLFQLSFLHVGKYYEISSLTEAQKGFVKLLAEFGLIYRPKSGSRRYYPTELAVNLMTQGVVLKREGYIVAETNNQVYIYCKSTLTIRILSVIVDLKVRLPNLVIGKITRPKIRDAFSKGITAQQIIDFLEQNSHVETQKLEFPIPETLIHRIQLWEMEENAVQPNDGVLYERFSSHEEYELLKRISSEQNILLWCNDITKLLFIRKGGEDYVDEQIQQLENSR